VFGSIAGQVEEAAAGFAEDELGQLQLILHVERDLLSGLAQDCDLAERVTDGLPRVRAAAVSGGARIR